METISFGGKGALGFALGGPGDPDVFATLTPAQQTWVQGSLVLLNSKIMTGTGTACPTWVDPGVNLKAAVGCYQLWYNLNYGTGQGSKTLRTDGVVDADTLALVPLDSLLARLRALLRRHNSSDVDGTVLRFEDLTLNPQTREVHRGTRLIELTKIEFDLLELFLHHPRQVLTRDQILDLVWGYTFDSGTNSLAVYIGYLRRKLEEGSEVRLIQTVRGVGYALRTA